MDKNSGSNGRTKMRSRPSFLVVALFVVTAFLAFKYWSLSSANRSLLSQVGSLEVQLREITSKHSAVEKQAVEFSKLSEEKTRKVTELEAKVGETTKKLSESQSEVGSLKDQLKNAQDTQKKAEEEKSSVQGELDKVQKELTDLKAKPPTCDQKACKEPLREVLGALTKTISKALIKGALKQSNVDVMPVAADLLQEPEQPKQEPEKKEKEQ